jgi:SAM-dependent methyltransferase
MNSTKQGAFYDEHPFDWVGSYDPAEGRAYISPLLLQAIDSLDRNALALDIGCGAGRVLSYLGFRGQRCAGFDRSLNSLRIAFRKFQQPVVTADNCSLPIRDAVADMVISDGVIHHTQDAQKAFSENCRILKPGGILYLAVYKPGGRYEFLYRYPGSVIRAGLKRRSTRWLVHLTALPVYFSVHWLRSGGKVSWQGAKNLFYDYFASPQVLFLSREAVETFCRGTGVSIADYDFNLGTNVHSFLLRKG